MNRFSAYALASGLAAVSMLTGTATADQWNKKTILTISEPIAVPNQVLQPGKYVMRLLDSPSNRHIVQLFNEDETKLITTVLALPNYRLQPTGETQFGFYETPAGQPKVLRSWFYPGDNFGQEFAYPKDMAVQIAKYSNTNVPTTYAQNEAELASARVGTVDRAGTELELDRQTYSGPQMAQATPAPATPAPVTEQPAPVTPAPVTEQPVAAAPATPAPADQPAATPAPATLPSTASPVPLIGLMGFLSLGAAAALRAANKR